MTDLDATRLAIAELSSQVNVGLAEIKGQLALLVQRAEHSEQRTAELAKRVDADRSAAEARHAAIETRLDAIERDAVTRPQLTERTRQIIGIVTAITGVIGLATTIVVALVRP